LRPRSWRLAPSWRSPIAELGPALAIRQWARTDKAAAAAVASVDAARLQNVAQLYRQLGLSSEDAQARAVLFYAFIFGQSLLVLDESPRKRASLTAACAHLLTELR
jgi:hypothetical protein